MQKSVFIVNPDAEERDRLCRSLGADPAWRVVGLAGCRDLLAQAAERADPDVVLIEPAALRQEGVAGQIAEARKRWNDARVVVFTEAGNGGRPDLQDVEILPRPSSLLRVRSLVASSGARSPAAMPAARLPGFEGYLEGIPLADLIQILCVTRRTGRLRLQAVEGGGELSFVDGEVVHARDGGGEGDSAFYRIMWIPSGRFGFDDGIKPRATTIRAGWEHLLMEAMRLRDEAATTQSDDLPSDGSSVRLDPAAERDLSGRQVGSYQLVRIVDRYADGALYEALHPSIRDHPHIFVLDAGVARDPMRVGRMLRRAQTLLGIRHPNLVRTIAGGESEGIPYCVEEHIEGVSLHGRMREQRYLDGGQVMAVFRECLRGLGRLHAEGLGHGRIDGGAIILAGDGIPRLGRLNGFLQQEPTLEEDVASLAATIRAALRPAESRGEVDELLASVAAGRWLPK